MFFRNSSQFSLTKPILLVLFAAPFSFMGGAGVAHASGDYLIYYCQVGQPCQQNTTIGIDCGLNKTTYAPGETVSMTCQEWSDGNPKTGCLTAAGDVNGGPIGLGPNAFPSCYSRFQIVAGVYGSASVGVAPSSPGSGYVYVAIGAGGYLGNNYTLPFTVACPSGTIQSGSSCVVPALPCSYSGPLSWGSGCSANSSWSASSGGSVTISNTAAGYTGSEQYTCNNGTWTGPTNVSCVSNAVAGICGSANGYTYPNGSSSYSPYTQCSSGSSSNGTFPSAGSTTYWTCSGSNGGSASPTCSASQAAPATPTVTLSMSPTSVAYGGYTNLSYTSSNASYCNEYVNGGLVWPNAPTSVNWGTVGPYYSNQTWTIVCYNSAGASGQDSKTLTVAPPPAASCSATTIGSCNLSSTSSGGSSGSCTAGYSGSCSYSCSNGTWYQNSNSCTPPAASCSATTIGSCNLSSTSSGGSSGSCSSGYIGSCSYACSNGTWYVSSNSCAAPANCTTPWGSTIASGVSVSAFQSPSVTAPATCASDPSETRTCTNGTLSGSYQYQNCTVLNPTATISASPTRVQSGKTTTVSWSSTDTTSCSVTGPGLSASGTSGSQAVTVTTQSTYTVSCNGGAATATVLVNVVPTFQEF